MDDEINTPTTKSASRPSAVPSARPEILTLKGMWSSRDWRHDNEKGDKERTRTDDAEFYEEEDGWINGRFCNVPQGEYIFQGRINNQPKDTTYSGIWRSTKQDVPTIAHGAFHFKILDEGKRMLGLWTGLENNETLLTWGTWEWKRHGVNSFPSMMEDNQHLLSKVRTPPLEWSTTSRVEKIKILSPHYLAALIAAAGTIIAALVK